MGSRQRAALAAMTWTAMVAAGLGACGGGGGGGAGADGAVGGSPAAAAGPARDAGGAGSTGPVSSVAVAPGSGTTGTSVAATSLAGTAPAAASSAPASAPVLATPSAAVSTTASAAASVSPAVVPPQLADCDMFPAEAVFNTRIDDSARFPAHASSASWIASIGGATAFRADWWKGDDPTRLDAYYGLPLNTLDGTPASTAWPVVLYDFAPSGRSSAAGWPHESDCAVTGAVANGFALQRNCGSVPASQRRFPFPLAGTKNEGGTCNDPASCGDHHVLVVEQGACRLWEAYHAYQLSGQWYALSTAAWDLKSTALRPLGWTAADAAGLPITPFVARAAEASSGEIRHALRVTFRNSALANSFVWPARHAAGSAGGSVPFGALLRLRADFVIPSGWTTQAKAIATAAKRYGLYVADLGSDFHVQGEPSTAWEEATFRQLAAISLGQMEFVDLRAVTGDARFDADSMAARWN